MQVFPYSVHYIFFEQYLDIEMTALINIAIALGLPSNSFYYHFACGDYIYYMYLVIRVEAVKPKKKKEIYAYTISTHCAHIIGINQICT